MAGLRCESCGAPVTGYVCEYCGSTTVQKYLEILQEQKRLEKLKYDAENTVIPVHLSEFNMDEIKRRLKHGERIYL